MAHPDRVAVLAPMVSELRPVVKAFRLEAGAVEGVRVHTGRLGDVDVVATRIGMGTRAAREATERLLAATEVDHVLVVGIAGGVVAGARIGDVLRPSVVRDHATGAEYEPHGLVVGETEGVLLTSDEFFGDPGDVARLAEQGVVGLDMETAAVAAVCGARRVPWSVVRVVSDRPGEVPPEVFLLGRDDGTPDVGKALRYMVRRPARIPPLVRLARNSQRAANRAAASAVTACTRR